VHTQHVVIFINKCKAKLFHIWFFTHVPLEADMGVGTVPKRTNMPSCIARFMTQAAECGFETVKRDYDKLQDASSATNHSLSAANKSLMEEV